MSEKKLGNTVLTLPLYPEKWQIDIIEKRFRIMELLKNALIAKELRRLRNLQRTRVWRRLEDEIRSTDKTERKKLYARRTELLRTAGFSKYGFYEDIELMQKRYIVHIGAQVAQRASSDVWQAFEKMLYGNGDMVHFHKAGSLYSIANKKSGNCMIFRNGCLEWNGGQSRDAVKLILPSKARLTDYERQMLEKPIKYYRVIRKWMKTRWKYYVQITLAGETVHKDRPVGAGRVGIDIGTRTIAVAAEKAVFLRELADGVDENHRRKCALQRKMDNSRRCTNPENYNPDGTVRRPGKGHRPHWVKSRRYLKMQAMVRNLERKNADIRKYQHICLANEIIRLGTDVYVEQMSYSGLQRRAKETTYDDKGRTKKKKRFGKSLANKAPASFLLILNQKLSYLEPTGLKRVDTKVFRASQLDHTDQSYHSKKLGERWTVLSDGTKVQRDMYSAFLLMNSNAEMNGVDLEQCNQTFERFKYMHDRAIETIRNDGKQHPASFGV
ncbi:MAG: hypothetical protein PUI95_00400 [Eubacteriales bacterium]|nr:hypothetical protein [Eubacteriales bacterium]